MSDQPAFPHLQCVDCGYREPLDHPPETCFRCGGGWLDVIYDYERLAREWPQALRDRPWDMWRYQELLPLLDAAHRVTMGEGGTPLLRAVNLGMMMGCPHIYVKDERQGPTGSFKDRQASLSLSVMKEMGITEGVVASTGNVAISYSAYSSLAGIKLWAFVTSLVPAEKMREVAIYGSEVIKVTGTYDQTKQVAARFAERRGLFRDRGIRSFAARESMKTVAFEIAEQLPQVMAGHGRSPGQLQPSPEGETPWRAPDWYIQAVSGGMGPVGVWKGYEELMQLGLVDKMPRLACIQAEGCAPMVWSFQKGLEEAEPVLHPRTRIITLATGSPGPAYVFLAKVIREHGGVFEAVSDEETFRAVRVMAELDGISMERAAGVAFAGLFKLISKGVIKRNEIIVVNCSGHTFPVEKHLLGDEWAREVQAPAEGPATEEGLLGSLESLDRAVRRIAILEDDPNAARLLRRILQARGDYQIFEARDGRTGLEMLRREQPDVLLLDLMMPQMDGFQVLEALEADEDLCRIPVVVVTAKELTTSEKERLSGQIQMLLEKGDFTDEDLLHEVLDALEEGKA
ncbi:MAG: pyridoxal-phosphate dependent enzyme [Anaerolineae bacterium]|jgi:threonine synthase